MKTQHLIIDGYCLLHRDPELQSLTRGQLELARHLLVHKIARVCDMMAKRTTIVFDGQSRGRDAGASSSSIDVIYSHKHETADTVIEIMTVQSGKPESILVVTSDRAEMNVVLAAGAEVMSCSGFMDRCNEHTRQVTSRIRQARSRQQPHRLGDHFPDPGMMT